MGKALYIGVAGVARKGKKMYLGVSNVARKIKKAYIGVGGTARLFFSADAKLTRLGSVATLSTREKVYAGAAAGINAVFVSPGFTNSFDATFARQVPAAMPSAMSLELSGVSAGEYAIFSGGTNGTSVYAYNSLLQLVAAPNRSDATNTPGVANCGLNHEYAVFATGRLPSAANSRKADAYTTSLVKIALADMKYGCQGLNYGISVGEYALFLTESSSLSQAYDRNLVRVDAPGLTVGRSVPSSANIDYKFGLFMGGEDQVSPYPSLRSVEYYDSNLTRSSLAATLPNAVKYSCGASLQGFAMSFGGMLYNGNQLPNATAFDINLVRTYPGDLSFNSYRGATAVIEAGGTSYAFTTINNMVDVYKSE